MALRPNPLTGALEEDGLPEDPAAIAPAPVIPTQFENPTGGAPPPPINVQVGSPDRPVREIEQRVQGSKAAAAQDELEATQARVDAAAGMGLAVDQQQAGFEETAANDRVKAREAQQKAIADAEIARQKRVGDSMAEDEKEIAEQKRLRIEAGRADDIFWEGKSPVAKLFTRLLLVVGGTAHDASGRGGPSPVDTALSELVEGHRRKLVGRYEATKEAFAQKRANRAAWETEMERRSIAANNQSLLALDLIDDKMKAAIAGLSKEKQAAAMALWQTKLDEQRAGVKLDNATKYDAQVKRMEFALGAGQPKTPLASREDVEAATKLEQAAQEREELAAKIEANEQSWKNVQTADKEYADEEVAGEIPGAGRIGKAASRAMRGHDVAAKLAKSGSSLGRAFGGIFGEADKVGAEVARGLEKVKTETAKAYGGAVTETDAARSAAELGVQSQDAKGMAATLRRQAQQMREKSTAMRAQRTFRQGPATGGTPEAQTRTLRNSKTGETKRQRLVGGKWQDL